MEDINVFPLFNLGYTRATGHSVKTILRKKHRGQWYDVPVVVYGPEKALAMKRFTDKLYKTALFHVVDPLLREEAFPEEFVNPLSADQREESVRLGVTSVKNQVL